MILDSAYYCGWTIAGRDALAHIVASREFPTAGSSRRAWCGERVVVIGLTLDARRLPLHCAECNQRLKQMASQPELDSGPRSSPVQA